MPKKQCLWPGDGTSPCVVVPKIQGAMKSGALDDGKFRVWIFTGQNAESDADYSYRFDTESECAAAYDSLVQAIRAWWEE